MTETTLNLAEYVDQTAALIGLPIPADYHASVVENFNRIATVAKLVTEFPMIEEIEIAPVFEP